MNPEFIFIGGTERGFRLLKQCVSDGFVPKKCFILKEDDHEKATFSMEMVNLCKQTNINYELRKKLLGQDEEYLKSRKFDFAIVCGWRTIINPALNNSFKIGMVAAHDSLLPQYRGFAPLNWAIINGEKQTGVTLFLIGDGDVDSGLVISQTKVTIKPTDYAYDVFEKISNTTTEQYKAFIKQVAKGKKIELKKQDERNATYTCKRTPADGKIEWKDSSNNIYNLIRGLTHPYPGAFCSFGDNVFHIHKALLGKNNRRNYIGKIPGRVIGISKEGIEVMCGQGTILIAEWENKQAGLINNPNENVKSITVSLR